VATISLTPEGKIDQAQQRLLRLALTAELPQGFQDPKKENQVNLILAPEGILWHGPVDHLNGRQRTAVADLAKGMEKRLEQDPYTVAAKWGEGMGPLARDLYHAFRDSLRTLEENQSTRLTIVKQNGRHRAFHLSPNSPDYLAHIELLRSSSARIGLATVNVETPLEGAKVPYDQVSIILHLGELADAEPVRQAFLHMGRLLANRVSVNFVDGPSGGSGRPVGPSGGSIPPRPAPGSPKPAAPAPAPKPAVPKAPAQSAVRRRPSESEPLREREEPLQESDIVEDVPLEAIEQIPAAPRAPAEFTVGRASPPAGVPKTSSIPPPPRFRISAMQAATGTVKDLASSEIRMGQTGKGGAPAYFERIAEFGELGGATYEGIDYQAKGGNEDGIGRFFGPNKSLTVVISDGAGQHYGGREATELVLQTFARQVPHGKSVKEITPLVTRAIQRLEREQVNKEFNLQIPEGQTVKDFVEGLKAKKDPQNPDKQDAAAVELAYKIRHFAKKIDPQAAVAIARINRPDRPGQPYTLQPYWAGDAKIIVQRLVDGEWKLVWESVDHTMAQNIIGRLSEQDFRNYFGNIPRDLAVRLHDQNNVIINSFSKEGPGDRLATLEGGHSTDLAQTVTLPDGEQALVLRPGDRVIWATDGMTEGRGTTEQIVEMAALHKPGQNPAKAYLYNNVRRQTALKQARQAIEQKGESAEDDLRVPVILEEGRELWVNDRGAVYARESGGNAIDYLKSDNFGIQVLDFNPMDLKTAAQPAVPRSPLPQLPDLGKPRTPIPPPPRRSSPAAPRRRTPTEGFPSIPPLPPRTPRPSPPPLPAKALPLTTRKTGSPVPPPIPPAARVSKSPPPSRVPPTVPEGPRVKAVLPPPPMPPQAARTQVGVPVVPPPIPLSALADGPIAAGPISRRPTPPSMRPRQPQVLNMAPPAVEAFQSRPPLFEEGVFKVGDYSSLTVFLGKAPLWGKPGMSSHTADTYRIDLANSGVKSDTYATLVRVAPNVFNLTNNQKKHRIYVTGKGLSSPMEIAPGETKRVLVGQTIEIGSYQLPLAAFGS
jgi:serine/threonine protein phosphatase PrpC